MEGIRGPGAAMGQGLKFREVVGVVLVEPQVSSVIEHRVGCDYR